MTRHSVDLTFGRSASVQLALGEARTVVQQQYTAIREALDEEEQTALLCVKKEESRVLGGLEETLGGLKGSLRSIQQGLHVLESLADAKGDKHMGEQAFITVRARREEKRLDSQI